MEYVGSRFLSLFVRPSEIYNLKSQMEPQRGSPLDSNTEEFYFRCDEYGAIKLVYLT